MRSSCGSRLVPCTLAIACLVGIHPWDAFAEPVEASAHCNQPAPEPITYVQLPGHPFEPIATRDGCWIFVSLLDVKPQQPAGIAVLRRAEGKVSLVRVIPVEGQPLGIVLTHDGKLLIAASDDRVAFVDVARMISGGENAVLGYASEGWWRRLTSWLGKSPGIVYVNVTADDRFLFASDEQVQTISVFDLQAARRSGFRSDSMIGRIPVAMWPIALTFSPDERYLYTTSEVGLESYGWPAECKPEGGDPAQAKARFPQGAIIVVDVGRAKSDPGNSVVAKAKAGCSPVRLVTSPRGETAYVTARNDNALLVFDARKLVRDPNHALIGKIPLGTAPVGVAVADGGRKVIVAISNRFSSSTEAQRLTVIDAGKVSAGPAAVLGTVPAGGFPRELQLTPDGRTLLVTNFTSKTLELVDLTQLPFQPRPAEWKASPH